MTNPDYRAMCAELVELCTPVDSIPQLAERLQKLNALADRARALLAEPEAEPVVSVKQQIFPTPSQAAECGGPCYEGSYCPEACDCGLYHPPPSWRV